MISVMEKKLPLDELNRRAHMREDGLACLKWPQEAISHGAPSPLAPWCQSVLCEPKHMRHIAVTRGWRRYDIQKTDPVCFSSVLLIDTLKTKPSETLSAVLFKFINESLTKHVLSLSK